MSYTYPEALNAMERIATDLLQAVFPGKNLLVSVAADGATGTASVDWQFGYYLRVKIFMPVRPATYRMTQDEFMSWAAYILHEVGHPAHTDKLVWDAAVARNAHRLLNALEDVREEKATIDLKLANNALQVFSRLIDGLHAKAVAGGYDPNHAGSIGWTLSALGRRANGYAVDLSDIDAKLDPKGTVGQIVAWAIPALGQCQSTQDCLDLADRVVKAINDAQPKRPEPQKPEPQEALTNPEPKGSEPQEDEEGVEEPAQEEEQEPTASDAPAGLPPTPKSEEEQEEQEQEREKGGAGGEGGEPFSDADIEAVSMQPTEKGNIETTGQDSNVQRNLTNILRRVAKNGTPRESEITGRERYNTCGIVAANASRMGLQRALLAKALKASDIDSYDVGRTMGRLNMRALAKAASGSDAIFGKRTVTEGYDTDVQVLVDGSSSMNWAKMVAASSLALVVAQAASQVGVDCFVHLFNDDGLRSATKGKARPVAKKFGYLALSAGGSTPLTERMLEAADMQNRRARGKRRIMFIITDGCCNSGRSVAKAAGEYIEAAMGVEIANLHIGHAAPGMFRNEVAVDPENAQGVGLKKLTSLLERGI